MDQELFSNSLPAYGGKIENERLSSTLSSLKVLVPKQELILKAWDDQRVAVSIVLDVSIPQFGTADDIDIVDQEPVLLVFDLANYPYRAPKVFADRLDFPKDKVGHMYIATGGKPPGLCLVRGSLDEWYATRQIKTLVARIQNWLGDAAAGTLLENGDEFEPLRLEGYSGSLHYDYDELFALVKSKQSFLPGGNYAKALFERITSDDKAVSWRYIETVTVSNIQEKISEVFTQATKDESSEEKKHLYFGYILWSDLEKSVESYDVVLPSNWAELKEFCANQSICLEKLEEELVISKSFRAYVSVPIIVAIRRPKNLIGFSGDLEFINFHVRLPDEDIVADVISDNQSVAFKQHEQPLTLQKAREISGYRQEIKGLSLVAGCGALGSRILLHLAKSGYTSYFIADNDKLMPHNFVRHPLSSNYVNQNKALALKKELDQMYSGSKYPADQSPVAFNKNADALVDIMADKSVFKRILDFTASPVFSQKLVQTEFAHDIEIIKSYLSNMGKMGVLLVEGRNRNPRIDDLQALLYNQATEDDLIANWLKREADVATKTSSVTVGIGCNSETTILSDEDIACHAAILTNILRKEILQRDQTTGKVYINQLHDEPFFRIESKRFQFGKLDCFNAINDPAWSVRYAGGVIEKMKQRMLKAAPYETGGVLIGVCNYKTLTIHVTSLIDAPPDSRATRVCFFRGISGLAGKIDAINESTGGQIGYIGEWHSHPKGPECLSDVDMATVEQFKDEYAGLSPALPVFLTILTRKNILPYVY